MINTLEGYNLNYTPDKGYIPDKSYQNFWFFNKM